MSKFELLVCEEVDQGRGFRLRTSVVDWQGRASGKRARSPITTRPRTSRNQRVTRRRQQVVKGHFLCDDLVSGVEVTPRPLESFAWLKLDLYRLIAWLSILAYLSLIGQATEYLSPQLEAQSNLVNHAQHTFHPFHTVFHRVSTKSKSICKS